MEKSESLKAIGTALTLFHTKMEKIKRDATNPFFKSRYATLSNILESINIPLAESGLSFTQIPDGDCLCTILIHNESGEAITGCYKIHPVRNDPQSIGSAITYARRYALSAILGINIDEDDDANAATTGTPQSQIIDTNPITGDGQKKYADDKRPWLSDAQYEKALKRINDGETSLFEQIKKEFKMKKDYNKGLYEAHVRVSGVPVSTPQTEKMPF